MISITNVRYVGKVHNLSYNDILGHDESPFFPKIGFIRMGYVISVSSSKGMIVLQGTKIPLVRS